MSGSERERLGQRDLVGVLESHGARRAAWPSNGGEWCGSCPQIDGRGCGGGTDRAHVTAAGVYGCRRCPDRGRAVWAAAQRAHMADSAPAAPHLSEAAAAEAAPADRTAKVAAARRVWADAHPVADTPAHAYLAARGVWPSGWAPSADMVRWYAPTDAEVLRRIGWAKAGADGNGLALLIAQSGTKSWVLRYRDADGQRRDRGLGPYPKVTLAQARRAAAAIRDAADAEPEPEPTAMTFAEAAAEVAAKLRGTKWRRNPAQREAVMWSRFRRFRR